MKKVLQYLAGLVVAGFVVFSCGTRAKVAEIVKSDTQASLEMSDEKENFLPSVSASNLRRDTIEVQDFNGRKVMLMKAKKDNESGDMVATDVINAAVVTARFRHLAERQGKVDIAFQIIVPEKMQDPKWQLRFYPDMFIMEDSVRLEQVLITGSDYRKAQLKGYQQYDRFISKIVSDSTKFIDVKALEIFLERNIPQLFAFKSDTNYVSDEEFLSAYGVSEQDAIWHYTDHNALRLNERRKARKGEMFNRYVRVPIVTEGIRLDTVIREANGNFVYNYVQTINSRPKLKRVDVVLSGEIFEKDQHIYDIPKCPPLTFYISTLSTFAIDLDKYLTKVVERRVSANTASHIDFQLGRSEVIPTLGNNAEEIDIIKENLAMLLDNNVFDLDSITVSATASPEGGLALNRRLAQSRSESVSQYFSKFMKHYRDSLERFGGFSVNAADNDRIEKKKAASIEFRARCIPENWEDLNRCIADDDTLTAEQKNRYFELLETADEDAREHLMQNESWYRYVKDKYYPGLRTVKFNFFLHRKGMVKDTVHTTVLDSVYIKGVQCLKNMDYEDALMYLKPYNDFNTAIAYTALNRNRNAMMILSPMERTAEVNYLLAILYARLGEEPKAVECYLKAVRQNDVYVHRGNLDPEISHLIKAYELNKYIDEMLYGAIEVDF